MLNRYYSEPRFLGVTAHAPKFVLRNFLTECFGKLARTAIYSVEMHYFLQSWCLDVDPATMF